MKVPTMTDRLIINDRGEMVKAIGMGTAIRLQVAVLADSLTVNDISPLTAVELFLKRNEAMALVLQIADQAGFAVAITETPRRPGSRTGVGF